ncbi:MAG: hypothetical protein ACP5XB_02565 [Isosphaeraceae bacterium]
MPDLCPASLLFEFCTPACLCFGMGVTPFQKILGLPIGRFK